MKVVKTITAFQRFQNQLLEAVKKTEQYYKNHPPKKKQHESRNPSLQIRSAKH